jgi:hypothetical protein
VKSTSTKDLIASALLWVIAASAAAQTNDAASAAPYNTELFNLLLDQKSPVDGKNHYQKQFDTAFNTMLAQSALAKSGNPGVSLRKRLLSGPQAEAIILRNKVSGQLYVYYEACQAHMCDETRLAVLYAPASNAMLGKLHLDGKDEYLGNPGASEKRLLDGAAAKVAPAVPPPVAPAQSVSAQPSPLKTVIDALASFKSFRMTSTQFDAVVAPYCKKVRNQNGKEMILFTYQCAPGSGITQIKMDSRDGRGQPLPNYMMLINIDFPLEHYAGLKTQIEKKLGRATPRGKDFVEWRYAADKALNENGNPVINLSRDKVDHSASFAIALEQGP